ncbi:uncharacterized protein J4E79_006484 [Alternaria viburni]|uniref:uncharacterized protein n=1 Tax=Alternaria viburni TaxID=566460 RepID=UPI0020C3D064|nr:uncharacterized protein J4E79_006484 [Alternaria viburni]KAI4658726.1 hypothetical protein J4E79_006484 [Alternaria viburni]
MAEHTKLITIDPNGDTLLKLKDIRWELPEWIDEATHFAPPAEITESSHEDTAAEGAEESDQRKHPEEVHFLVSSRQLRLVSTYFDNIFKKNFAESVADPADGRYHIWATEWNPTALEQLLIVAHARNTGVNENVSFDVVVDMALIVDYYDMHETPYTHAKRLFTRWWGNGTYRSLMPESVLHGKVIRWMFLSKVYKDNHISRRTIEIAKKHSKGPLQDLGLPLGNIPEKLEKHRQQAIKAIVDQLDSLIERLRRGEECCSFTCRSSVLGSLILLKQSGGLSTVGGGTISPPYYGTSLQEACAAMGAMVTRKQSSVMGGRIILDQGYMPVGACKECDFSGLFDRIMKKVDDDLKFQLDLSPSRPVKSSD